MPLEPADSQGGRIERGRLAKDARHTRGTELRRRGWDLLYIKEYLGHASVKSTEIYAEVDAQDVDTMMRRRPGFDFFNDMEE